MGVKYPNDKLDIRIWRRILPGAKVAQVWCDSCAHCNRQAWHDFKWVLYRRDQRHFLLECVDCYAREHNISPQDAKRVFRNRTGDNNPGRKAPFYKFARELGLAPDHDRLQVKGEYDRRHAPMTKADIEAKRTAGKQAHYDKMEAQQQRQATPASSSDENVEKQNDALMVGFCGAYVSSLVFTLTERDLFTCSQASSHAEAACDAMDRDTGIL